jgi:hypothetical protein
MTPRRQNCSLTVSASRMDTHRSRLDLRPVDRKQHPSQARQRSQSDRCSAPGPLCFCNDYGRRRPRSLVRGVEALHERSGNVGQER